jgi:nucleoside phosphorylase
VAGLALEARALARRLPSPSRGELILRTVGPGAARLDGLDEVLRSARPGALLVTGLAGGCAPGIAPGDLVIADPVLTPVKGASPRRPDARLRDRAIAAAERAGLAHRVAPLLTVPDVVATAAGKAACWGRHGAVAVDMESAPVLAWAASAGVPAVAVRAVADGPGEGVPAALLAVLDARGRIRPAALSAFLRAPGLAAAAWRLGRRSRRALAGLERFLQAFADAPVGP